MNGKKKGKRHGKSRRKKRKRRKEKDRRKREEESWKCDELLTMHDWHPLTVAAAAVLLVTSASNNRGDPVSNAWPTLLASFCDAEWKRRVGHGSCIWSRVILLSSREHLHWMTTDATLPCATPDVCPTTVLSKWPFNPEIICTSFQLKDGQASGSTANINQSMNRNLYSTPSSQWKRNVMKPVSSNYNYHINAMDDRRSQVISQKQRMTGNHILTTDDR